MYHSMCKLRYKNINKDTSSLDLTTSIIEEKINWWIRFAGYLL